MTDEPSPPTKTLTEIFNHFVKESNTNIPTTKGRLLIQEANERKTYGRDILDMDEAGYADKAIDRYIAKSMRYTHMGSYSEWGNDLNLQFIMFAERVKDPKAVPIKEERDILLVMDHELGHITIPLPQMGGGQQYQATLMENTADAYALIRFFQRNPQETETKNNIVDPFSRAIRLVALGDTVHFSSFLLQAVIDERKNTDYGTLTPKETQLLARKFAMQYTPTPQQCKDLNAKFKDVQDAHYRNSLGSLVWLKLLAENAIKDTNPYTFKVAKLVLDKYFEGNFKLGEMKLEFNDEYWNGIRAKLTVAAENINKQPPVVTPKPKKQAGLRQFS